MTEATNTAPTAEQVAATQAAAEAKAAEKLAAKAKKAEEAAAKKAAKAAEKAAAKTAKQTEKDAAKAASKQATQNEITRPKAGTITGTVWETFDRISKTTGAPASIKDSLAASPGVAEATVRTQYARWRKFHGISGRVEAPKAAVAPEATAPAAE